MLTEEIIEFFKQESGSSTRVPLNTFDFVYHACWCRYNRKRTKLTDENITAVDIEPQFPSNQIKLNISRAICSQKKCVFGCPIGRYHVSESTRAKDFCFYIPVGARVCDHHNKYLWIEVPVTTSQVFTADK